MEPMAVSVLIVSCAYAVIEGLSCVFLRKGDDARRRIALRDASGRMAEKAQEQRERKRRGD